MNKMILRKITKSTHITSLIKIINTKIIVRSKINKLGANKSIKNGKLNKNKKIKRI